MVEGRERLLIEAPAGVGVREKFLIEAPTPAALLTQGSEKDGEDIGESGSEEKDCPKRPSTGFWVQFASLAQKCGLNDAVALPISN